MIREIVYTTSDGARHTTPKRAVRHAESRYGAALSTLAHKLLRADKYSAMLEALDGAHYDFRELLELDADIALLEREDDEP